MNILNLLWIGFKIIFPILFLVLISIIIILLMGVDWVTAGWGIPITFTLAGFFVFTYISLNLIFSSAVILHIFDNSDKIPLDSVNTWVCYILYSLFAPGGFFIVPWELKIDVNKYVTYEYTYPVYSPFRYHYGYRYRWI